MSQLHRVCPSATMRDRWESFVQEYSTADICVAVLPEIPADLPPAVASLRRLNPLPSFVVVTHLDASHMLPFRRVCVDEFFNVDEIGPSLGSQLDRTFLATLRERLVQSFSGVAQEGDAVRQALAAAIGEPSAFRSVQALSRQVGVTTRTLEKQWHRRPANSLRLEDALWIVRLLYALELRQEGATVSDIAARLRTDVRSLQKASQRHLMSSLGSVSPESLAAHAAKLALLLSMYANNHFPEAGFGNAP